MKKGTTDNTVVAYLGLGTNLGDKEANLRAAVDEINKRIGTVVSLSACYETAPWGFVSPNPFLNAACGVRTTCTPEELLSVTQHIERTLGRAAKSAGGIYADRLIDIDLLLYGDLVMDTPTLTLPHPLMHLRRFVLEPLAEIAPTVTHPRLGKTISELLAQHS